MKDINHVSFLEKRVLLRVDFNVPLDDCFNITDDSRMQAAIPTIKKIINDGGRCILLSHFGRPKKGFETRFSLKHLVKHLSFLLNQPVGFSPDCIGEKTLVDVKAMQPGDVLILENLRFYPQEESGDTNFAKELASFGDIYINDAFGAAHRAHASISVIANYFPNNKYFGLLLKKEVSNLERVVKKPKRPFTAIIGGAKITGKIDVINSLFNRVDSLIIGGGMAYTFIKAMGGNIGNSLVEEDQVDLAKKLIITAKKRGINLLLPVDSVNANSLKNDAKITVSEIGNIPTSFIGLDIGNESVNLFSKTIMNSKTIVWNGPMGVFEMERFSLGTRKIAEAVCRVTEDGAFSLVGGGDSVAAITKFHLIKKVSYASTGGGAMLRYLEGRALPGLVAIEG